MKFSVTNNFDLIRLFAATQVAVTHTAEHLNYESSWISWMFLFPGVPIFFFVSGFLIYGSYEKSLDNEKPLRNFFINRFLRLYPALWLCILLSIGLLSISGYLSSVDFTLFEFSIWFFTSSTFLQFYNPEFLRGFGVGAINGSLWTIAVELQFYLLTPFLYFFLKKNALVIFLLIVFFCLLNGLNTHLNHSDTILQKLVAVSFFPWFYMFVLGALAYKYKRVLDFIKQTPLVLIVCIYVGVWYASSSIGLDWGNGINIVGYLVLVALVIKLAITKPYLADSLLNRNDISYGIYIYHMPIVNYLLYKNYTGMESWISALSATTLIALASWFVVERPFLRLKKKQFRSN